MSDEDRPAAAVQEIIVTARRKAEDAQKVPVSVAALSGGQLERQNVESLVDLQRVAPGLTVTPTALGTTRPAYQIRGQRAAATRITNDPAIVVYFAEIGTSRSAGSPQSLYDLESVQVLKGPQGTLFGRNTTGGAILITPKAPTRKFEGYAQVSAGDFGLRGYEGVLNLPLSDKAALRLAGKLYRRDGYFENAIRPGEKSWDEDNQSYRISLRLTPTDGVTSDVIGTYFTSDVTGFQPKLIAFNSAGLPIPALVPVVQAETAASQGLGFYDYREKFHARNVDDVKSIQNTTTVELGKELPLLGDARLKNIIGYRKVENTFSSFADGSALGILETLGFFHGTQFSEELQIQGKNGIADYVVGAFYSTEKGQDFTNLKSFGALPLNYTDLDGKNDSLSAFAHGNFDLSSLHGGLSLSAGARITRDKRFIDSHVRQQRTPTAALAAPFVCLANGTTVPVANLYDRSLCSFKTRATFTEPTWDISLNQQIDPDHLVYIAHRHGYRAGAAASATTPDLQPEKVDDIEVGSKNQFQIGGAPMRFNLVGYYGKYKQLQRNIAVVLNGVTASQDRNAAKAHVYGVESELDVRLNRIASVAASYALTEAKYDRYENVFSTSAGPVVVDDSSAIFAYTPKHMVSVTLNLDLPIAPAAGEATASLGYSYQSSFQTTDSNSANCGPNGIEKWCLNQPGRLPGYGLWNARADWRRPFGARVDVAVFVTNIAAKKYLAGAFPLQNVLGVMSAWPGPPRMVGFELRAPFGVDD